MSISRGRCVDENNIFNEIEAGYEMSSCCVGPYMLMKIMCFFIETGSLVYVSLDENNAVLK